VKRESFREAPGLLSVYRANSTILFAFRILLHYKNRIPSAQELQDKFGMNRSTAYRYRRAMVEAHYMEGIPTPGGEPREDLTGAHQKRVKRLVSEPKGVHPWIVEAKMAAANRDARSS
jgi:hypothetical protein